MSDRAEATMARDDDKTARMDAFLGPKAGPKKTRAKSIPASAMLRARQQIVPMMVDGDWNEAKGRHFVALFLVLHEAVYKVPCSEMDGPTCFYAAGMAKKLQDQHFDGSPGALVAFVKWTWERESSREKWRRENSRDGGQIGYRLQFGAKFITDYRLAMARKEQQP
jgi:hypothetical protein